MTHIRSLSVMLTLFIAATISPAHGTASAQPNLQANDEPTLVFDLFVAPESTASRLRDKELVFVATNRGDAPISLDRERLNIGLMCRVYDRHGKEISYLPGPPGSAPDAPVPLIILEPEGTHEARFSLSWLTDDRLRKRPYEIRVCYDNTGDTYTDARVDRFAVCAPPLVLQ